MTDELPEPEAANYHVLGELGRGRQAVIKLDQLAKAELGKLDTPAVE